MGAVTFSPGVKRPARDVGHLPSPSVEVNSTWNYTSITNIPSWRRHGQPQNFTFLYLSKECNFLHFWQIVHISQLKVRALCGSEIFHKRKRLEWRESYVLLKWQTVTKSADRLHEIPSRASQWHTQRRILLATIFSQQPTSTQLPLVYSRIVFSTVNSANISPCRHVSNFLHLYISYVICKYIWNHLDIGFKVLNRSGYFI